MGLVALDGKIIIDKLKSQEESDNETIESNFGMSSFLNDEYSPVPSSSEKQYSGIVVSVGSSAKKEVQIKEGDTVLFKSYGDPDTVMEGKKKYYVINEWNVIAKLTEK
jgi:phage gp45-like